MDPIRKLAEGSDWKLDFLKQVSEWLRVWKNSTKSGLSRETFLAVEHTCRSVAELSEYLISNFDFNFVLTGKLLSDPIEKRFGYYRQLSGANNFVSIRQVLENEKNIRLVSSEILTTFS